MRFFSSIVSCVYALAVVEAAVYDVQVGNGSLVYSPNTTYAAIGDTVVFHFWPRNHNVVQGPYNTPCMSSSGIYSGYIPSMAGEAAQTFRVTINNTDPIWYYCSQPGAGGHCTLGMVGVINPPNNTAQTLSAYKMAAAAIANTSYTQPSMIGGGVIVTAANATNATSATSAGMSATSSTGASATSSRAVAATSNVAIAHVASGAGAIIAGGLVALLV